jgi:adenylyl-sulfate kinase
MHSADCVGGVMSSQQNLQWHHGTVLPCDRQKIFGQRPHTFWLTGLSGAGKSTLAACLESRFIDAGRACYVLDGDNVRHGLNQDLGFSPQDRMENIRRVAEVAHLMNDAGLIVITAFISPYRDDREMARKIIGAERFIEVHLSTSLATCELRDPKGLYLRARQGLLADFTGVSAPYEQPQNPAITIDTSEGDVDACVDRLLSAFGHKILLTNAVEVSIC